MQALSNLKISLQFLRRQKTTTIREGMSPTQRLNISEIARISVRGTFLELQPLLFLILDEGSIFLTYYLPNFLLTQFFNKPAVWSVHQELNLSTWSGRLIPAWLFIQ